MISGERKANHCAQATPDSSSPSSVRQGSGAPVCLFGCVSPVATALCVGPQAAPPMADVTFEQIRRFVGGTAERCSLDLSPETRLLHDLGLDADDAEEFLQAFADEFSVDMSGFPFERYFGTEVDAGIRWCTRKLLGDRGVWKAPLSLQQLMAAARAGKWEAQS